MSLSCFMMSWIPSPENIFRNFIVWNLNYSVTSGLKIPSCFDVLYRRTLKQFKKSGRRGKYFSSSLAFVFLNGTLATSWILVIA